MRPRNKYEKRVAEIDATLFKEDISVSDAEWAKKACKNWDMTYYCYFTIFVKYEEFEIKRLYRIYKCTDNSTDHFFFFEIMREFNDGERKMYFGKQRTMGHYYDCFLYNSDMELRGLWFNACNYQLGDLFELSMASRCQHGGKRILCDRDNPNQLIRVIKNNPVAETLYKTHDKLFNYLLWSRYPKQVCRAITLAKRHGFVFSEETTSIWFDMVHAIIYCKKDYHNPVFIAPKNLMETHDKFVDMEFRKRRKDREERERRKEEDRIRREYEAIQKQLEEDNTINEKYVKRRKRFYDMVLTDGLISCRVLRDVNEFKEEGVAMAHCVFRCKYYNKPYSLILSARIGEERVETIEVDLTHYTIKQCYGKHDQFTMHHQRIIDLVNAQMDTIKAYNRNRRSTKTKIAV